MSISTEAPEHASLPLWEDKSDGQKNQTLKLMLKDLKRYAEITGVKIEIFTNRFDVEQDNEERLSILMSAYADVMAAPNEELLRRLKAVVAYDEQEALDIARTIEFLESTPNGLCSNCSTGHVTGSALVIHPESNRILLHRHKKRGIWLQFGGHPDYDTHPSEVALREGEEESGLTDLTFVSRGDVNIPVDIEVQTISANSSRPCHLHFDVRHLVKTDSPQACSAAEGESGEFMWLTPEECLSKHNSEICPALKRLIIKAQEYMAATSPKPANQLRFET